MLRNRENSPWLTRRTSLPFACLGLALIALLLWPLAGGQAAETASQAPNRTQAVAEQVTLNPIKDNTLYYNLSGAVSNGAGEFFFAGNTAAFAARRGVMAFDLAGQIPPGSVVTEVELQLYMSKSISGDQPVALHRLLQDWGEGTSDAEAEEGTGAPSTPGDATWLHTFYDNLFWTATGGDFVQTASATTTVGLNVGWYTWTTTTGLVADVQSWVDQPDQNFGWLLMGNERDGTTAKRFNTRENGDPSTVPVLSITFIPPRLVYIPMIVADTP